MIAGLKNSLRLPWPLHWRAALAGVLIYWLCPLAPLPAWQWPWASAEASQQAVQVEKISQFQQQYGEAGWPALRAQLALNRLAAYEAELTAAQITFASQRRDSGWAEATEFIIDHVSKDISNNQLQLQRLECRNNLCQLAIAAPQGLTPAFQAQILKLAGASKTAGLEYHALKQQRQQLVLELKSDKTLQFSWWQRWRLNPADKALWIHEIKTWLHSVAVQPPEPAGEDSLKPTAQNKGAKS